MPEAEYLQFGGMAVVEGVMMRSPNYWALACRAPNGQIIVQTEPLEKTWIGRQKWLKKPFLRGTLALLDTMALGLKAMRIAGDIQLDPKYLPEDERPKEAIKSEQKHKKSIETFQLALAIVISLAFGFFLFNIVPQAIAQFIRPGEKDAGGTSTNYIAEVVKIIFFIGYLALIRRMPQIYEVFKFHGAEHKAINTMEAKEPLTMENCQAQTRLHPRCGTNFAIVVLIVSLLLFPLIPRYWLVGPESSKFLVVLTRIATELVLLPIVAGISYEVIRLAGKFKNQTWVNILLKPGLMTQLITTAPPEEKHVEVAIASLQCVITAEETGELTTSDDYGKQPAIEASPA